jgi:hypothetical protein
MSLLSPEFRLHCTMFHRLCLVLSAGSIVFAHSLMYFPSSFFTFECGFHRFYSLPSVSSIILTVRELMGWVRNVILMNVYLDLENPGGSEFRVGGYMSQVREWGSQFMSNLGTRWTDPVTARRVPSK